MAIKNQKNTDTETLDSNVEANAGAEVTKLTKSSDDDTHVDRQAYSLTKGSLASKELTMIYSDSILPSVCFSLRKYQVFVSPRDESKDKDVQADNTEQRSMDRMNISKRSTQDWSYHTCNAFN